MDTKSKPPQVTPATDAEVARVADALTGITPLPWEAFGDELYGQVCSGGYIAEFVSDMDARAIAVAMSALPSLLARIERDGEELSELRAVCGPRQECGCFAIQCRPAHDGYLTCDVAGHLADFAITPEYEAWRKTR